MLENVRTSNYDISIVSLEGVEYDDNVIDNNEISIKYMLSTDSLFRIENRWEVVVEIGDTLYIDRNTYDVEGNESYFTASGILSLMIDNDITDRRFRFTNCLVLTRDCRYSQYFIIVDTETTDDELSFVQYYVSDTKVNSVKQRLQKNNTPVIAIIDDGVNIVHEELRWQNWINRDEIPGNGIDDDRNGYIDDYHGWNFVDRNNIMTPQWSHGTNVAGVLWAINNNNIWIAWILEDVEIMPLIACKSIGCSGENIKWSIKYAVDNGADIINMSLWWEWFTYTSDLNEVINYANSKWVVLVIAAGNGDILSDGEWVNTSVRKISPVCGGEKESTVIGVASTSIFSDLTQKGFLSPWSNFGGCVDVSTYGESIVSINTDGWYDTNNGTSFSAPIITGIVGLGFTQYGAQDPEIVHKSLLAAIDRHHGIDATVYMRELASNIAEAEAQQKALAEQQIREKQLAQTQIIVANTENSQNKYIPIFRKKIWDRLAAIPDRTLQNLIVRINRYLIRDISPDFTLKLEALKFVIQEYLNK